MKNKIEILCPSKKCPRCKKLIRHLENILKKNHLEAEVVVLTHLKEFLRFRTWILPSVFVNGNKVSRGYLPKEKDLIAFLKTEEKL